MNKFEKLITLLCLGLVSCTSYDIENYDSPSEVTGSKTPSIEELIEDFRATHRYDLSTKAGGVSDLNILDIQKDTYVFDIADSIAGSPLLTKSGDNANLAGEITLSTVVFRSPLIY